MPPRSSRYLPLSALPQVVHATSDLEQVAFDQPPEHISHPLSGLPAQVL